MKELLNKLNIEEEKASQILELFEKSINQKLNDYEELKKINNQKDLQLKDLKANLEELRKIDVNKMSEELDKIKLKNQELQDLHKKELTALKIENAIENYLLKNKAKNNKAVRALLDMEKISISDTGEVIGLNDQITSLVSNEDTKFLFHNTEENNTSNANIFSSAKPAESMTIADTSTFNIKEQFTEKNQPTFEAFTKMFEKTNK